MIAHAELFLEGNVLVLCLVEGLRKNILILTHRLVQLLRLLELPLEVRVLTFELRDDTNFELALFDHLQEPSITLLQFLIQGLLILILLIDALRQVGHLGQKLSMHILA